MPIPKAKVRVGDDEESPIWASERMSDVDQWVLIALRALRALPASCDRNLRRRSAHPRSDRVIHRVAITATMLRPDPT